MVVVVIGECQLWLLQFDDGEVCGMNTVVYAGQAECEVFIGQQADAAIVLGCREDGDLQPRRIEIDISLAQRQFAVVIHQHQPTIGDKRECVAGQETMRFIRAKRHLSIGFYADDIPVPLLAWLGQSDNAPVFFQSIHIGCKGTK